MLHSPFALRRLVFAFLLGGLAFVFVRPLDAQMTDISVTDRPTVTATLAPPPPLVISAPQLSPYTPPATALTTTVTLSNGVVLSTTLKPPPAVHLVRPGDTTSAIAMQYGVDFEALVKLNHLRNPDVLAVGTVLRVPGGVGGEEILASLSLSSTTAVAQIAPRGGITERLTLNSQSVTVGNPFYHTTWLTFYGRPNVPIMGILGEHDLDELTRLLRRQAILYDRANGPALKVKPAYHLVYGMATRAPGDDGSHLVYISDEETLDYIKRGEKEGFGVILDVQIGALTPLSATVAALPFLEHENVHLAIDPEFALVYPQQTWPGNPIGYVTGAQINAVQDAMQKYMVKHKIKGPRILLIHQFLDEMIVDKEAIKTNFDRIALTISVDGWGPPAGKISKYNIFVNQATSFASFKLFYRWDEPLLSEREALGEDGFADAQFIETTPNMIIYQ